MDYIAQGGDDDDGDRTVAPFPRDSIRLVQGGQRKEDIQALESQWLTGSPLLETRIPLCKTGGSPYFEFGYTGYVESKPHATTTGQLDIVFPRRNHLLSDSSLIGQHGHGHDHEIDHSPPTISTPPQAQANTMDNTYLQISTNPSQYHLHRKNQNHDDNASIQVSSLMALCGLDIGFGIDSFIRSVSVWPRARKRISSFFANKILTEEELDIELECDLFHSRYGV